jgi:ADP-ribose pyrophosphatase YjhB (NUDIX family)
MFQDSVDSGLQDKDLYYVAVKVFLRDGDKLLITRDVFGSWDLPGGRIRTDEFEAPLEQVVDRKMKEELGDAMKYEIGTPCVFFRVERSEHGLNGRNIRIFAIGYEAKFTGGELNLGKNHDRMKWVDILDFQPENYFTGGWLRGIQEYLKLQ